MATIDGRMRTKRSMIQRRRVNGQAAKFDGCLCDLCQVSEGVDMHEIVNRARTLIRSDERCATYDEPLCSILCDACHRNSHNPHARKQLIWHNVDMYGMLSVIESLSNLSGIVKKDIMKFLKEGR